MVDGGKMSKSLGNLYTLEDLAERGYSAAEVRYVLISAHYSALELHHAQPRLRTSGAAKTGEGRQRSRCFISSLQVSKSLVFFADAWNTLLKDLNVPGALGSIFGTLNKLKPAALVRRRSRRHAWWTAFHAQCARHHPAPLVEELATDVPADIQALAQQRWDAKQAKDWAAADALRKQLEAAGWLIKDSKEGFTVVPK
jgi:cysteinyl-tRNA synthetase